MTTRSITDQITTLKTVTAEVSSSKDAALAFLLKAGIISEPVRNAKISGLSIVKASDQQATLTRLAAFASSSRGQFSGRTTGKKASVKHTGTRKTSSKKH
ncbi:hypothetical protein WG906_14705 [Pedobacter sp. P351]|uniref:hypothetical protein n=1 Tax=Pedobacter superstes TaxID=3133441 RepID=UPI0030ACDBEE